MVCTRPVIRFKKRLTADTKSLPLSIDDNKYWYHSSTYDTTGTVWYDGSSTILQAAGTAGMVP